MYRRATAVKRTKSFILGDIVLSLSSTSGDVAQLVRALPCHGRGRGFEPRRPRHSFQKTYGTYGPIVTIHNLIHNSLQ